MTRLNGKSHTIHLRGMNFHYLSWGDESKPLLCLLHGFLDHSHTFSYLASELVNDYYLVAWDARGHGQTDWIHRSGYYHFPDYLFDLELFLDALNRQDVILIGHSMGGMISSLYCGTFPAKMKALINMEGWALQGNAFSDAPNRVKNWIQQVKAKKCFKPLESLDAVVSRLKKTDPLLKDEQAYFMAEKGTCLKADGMYHWLHDPLHRTRSPQPYYSGQGEAFWQRITLPTLLLYGSKSSIKTMKEFQKSIDAYPNHQVYEIPEAAHNLHLHQPQLIGQYIKDFLRQL